MDYEDVLVGKIVTNAEKMVFWECSFDYQERLRFKPSENMERHTTLLDEEWYTI